MKCPLCMGPAFEVGQFPCLNNLILGLYFCNECRSVFRYPMPTEEQLAAFYEDWEFLGSPQRLRRRIRKCRIQAKRVDRVLRSNAASPDMQIMDLGAGVGGMIFALRERGWKKLQGLEPREKAIAFSREKLDVELTKGWLYDAHLHAEPMPDIFLLSHVLEHLANPERIISYLAERFPGKLLWIEVPNGQYDSYEKNGQIAVRLWLEQHLWGFTPQGICSLLNRCGCRVLDCEPFNYFASRAAQRKADLRLAVSCKLMGERMSGASVQWRALLLMSLRMLRYGFTTSWMKILDRIGWYRLPDEPFGISVLVRLPEAGHVSTQGGEQA